MDRQQAKLGLERTAGFAHLMSLPLVGSIIWCFLVHTHSAGAQIVPDGTLGADERSVVTPDVEINGLPSDRIDGGATRGANLFHSFQDFNVGEGRGAYFSNPAAIENILSRVTGNNASNILGTLGVLGDANLFLINPNGIVFGPNARLDVGGSFFASTADSLVFENGFEFSATNPEAPPLLTVNIPIGLRFREIPGSLVNQSVATNNSGESVGLQVQPESTLTLVGGDLAIESGRLTAPDGQIELGSIAGNNLVSLTPTDTGYVLGYEGIENFQDISLSQGAFVNTSGNGGGGIQVQGRNVTLSERSLMFADTQGSQNGGGVSIEASQLRLLGSSLVTADVLGSGQGGDVTIESGQLLVSDGSRVAARTFGEGNAGDLTFTADSVEVSGVGSSLLAQVESGATGDGGNMNIDTGQLLVQVGADVSTRNFGEGRGGNLTIKTGQLLVQALAEVSASNFGEGRGGNLTIDAEQLLVQAVAEVSASTFSSGEAGDLTVTADSVEVSGWGSGLLAQVESGATGKGGNLTIDTERLLVSDGADVSARVGSEATGNAGNILVQARDSVEVTGAGSFLRADVLENATGDGGNLTIDTGRLLVSDGADVSTRNRGEGQGGNLTIKTGQLLVQAGAEVSASTFSSGNAGDLTIETEQLLVQAVAEVSASTFSSGNAGDLSVTAESVEVSGKESGLFANVGSRSTPEAEERGALLTIDTGRLKVADGADVSASTFGRGDAGGIEITTGSLSLTNGAQLNANAFGRGKAGGIEITTDSLSLVNDSSLIAKTFGEGDAGSVRINANDTVSFDGSFAFNQVASTDAVGKAGGIEITTGSLSLTNGAQLNANTYGRGKADGIEITTDSLSLTNGAGLSASTFGRGDPGSVRINAAETVSFDGLASGAFSQVASTDLVGKAGGIEITTGSLSLTNRAQLNTRTFGRGKAGGIEIITDSLSLTNGAQLNTGTSGRGDAGSVRINAAETVSFDRSNAFSGVELGGLGNGGGIEITTGSLSLTNRAQLNTRTFGEGDAGSVRINAAETVSFDRSNAFSGVEPGGLGNGGGIEITTGSLSLTNDARLNTRTLGEGDAGSVIIDATDTVSFDGSFVLTQQKGFPGAVADAAEIEITTGSLSLTNGAGLSTISRGKGDAGGVKINAAETVSFDRSNAFSEVAFGGVGDTDGIEITTDSLSLTNGARLLTRTLGEGNAGKIKVNASDSVILSGFAPLDGGFQGGLSSGLIASTEEGARDRGGNISVTTNHLQVSDGAVLSTLSRSDFRGGNITVNANALEVTGGGQLTTSAFSEGNAGNIILEVSDRIAFSGSDPTFFDRFNQIAEVFGELEASVRISSVSPESGLFANTFRDSKGKGGDIFIDPRTMIIRDGAKIAVDSQGTGTGGSIDIVSGSLTLDNEAEISAETRSTDGGNITLQIDDLLILRRNRNKISTSAGTAEAGGDGGNIDIDADFIIAFPGNSDIAAYTAAFQTLQSLRGDLVAINPEVQFTFRDSVEPVYREYVDLLLQPEQPSQENLKRARNAIEALQLAELDDFFRDACAEAKPEQIDRLVDQASPSAAVFYTIILENRLAVILKLPEPNKPPEEQKLLYHSTSFNRKEELTNTLEQLQGHLIRDPERVNDIKNLSGQVYSWLIEPFEKNLNNSGVKTLVFVLDDSLRNLPMAVLYDGQKYLVEKYAVALTPGLQLLSPRPLAQVRLNALTAGISEELTVEGRPQPFAQLENVEKELESIPPEVRRAELLNQIFTKDNLQDQLESLNFSMVHMATHANFSSDPEQTYILAYGSEQGTGELIKVKDLDNLFRIGDPTQSSPTELLVLSACETATGDKKATLGLAGVAVRAGARSTLATLWQVNDESTAELMKEFYQQLEDDPEITKAEALQRAQLALWKNEDLEWFLPYFWASYVLVGNWL